MTPSLSTNGSVRKWRRYPAYRDSGTAWLDSVPTHWEIKQLKYAVAFQRGHDLPTDSRIEGDVPVVTSGGITAWHNCWKAKGPGIVTGRYGTVGEFHFVETNYWPHNTALYSIDLHGNFPRYLWYMLQSLSDLFLLNSSKSAVPGVDRNDLHPITVVVPSDVEQRAIVGFLDRETAKIGALIAKKERLIELLQEKRTALISHTVTRGLVPRVPMKESGSEWVASLPVHWQLKRLKHVAVIQTGLTLGKDYKGQHTVTRPYLRVANVQDGFLDLKKITEVAVPADDVGRHELCSGDVLMTEGGDFDKLGRGYVWEGQIERCLHQNHIFAVRPRKALLQPLFLAALMTSAHGKKYFTATSQQTTNLASTNSTKLKNLPLPVPPQDEQVAILAFLDEHSQSIDRLIAKVREAIEKLREYRTALISAAVTGKIDVRQEVV